MSAPFLIFNSPNVHGQDSALGKWGSLLPTLSAMRAVLLTLLLCGGVAAGELQHLSNIGSVKVKGRGAVDSPDTQFCSAFTLSNSAARRYLRSATIINTNERHYQFLWSPCFVTGTAVIEGKTADWRIEALGLGSITYSDGTEVMLGDERQRDRNGQ